VAVVEAPLALYRRYRPEKFSEVIGQDHVTVPLRNALSNNRVNHAYLFSGPRGCGKTTSARILARAINCEKGPIAEPCGECQSCTDLARGGPGSIDVLEIDAASHGGVDDARDLREKAFFSPVQSRYKIYIIDEAHMVTTQGFNALLKLVEEPPPHLKFIFATTEPDKVIGTIRSRTHHYPFRLVPPKQLADYMATLCEAEGVAIEPAALPLVVRAGAGSVRDSLSVLDQLIGGADADGVTYQLAVSLLGFTPDSLLDACVDGFAAHDSRAVFETVEKVIETGQDPKRFAEDLLRRLRDLVILSAVPNAVASGLIEATEDQGERLQSQAAGIGAAELTRAADIVAAGLLEMRGATAPRLQLELICAKVLLPGADDSTNGIQARLDRMERRLTIGIPTAEASTTPPSTPPVPAAAAPTRATAPPARASQGAAPAGPPSGGAPSQGAAAASSDRSGGWPEESAPAQPPVAHSAADQQAAAPPSSGSMGLADVRRLWPQILEAVKTKRRFAWIMLSQNAQVIAIDEQTITLGLINAGARESFARSGSDEILRQAMIDTIGLTRKVEAVVDPSTDPGAAAASQPPAPPAGTGASKPQSSAGPQGVAPPSAQLSAAAQPTTQVAASTSASAPTTQVPTPVQVSAPGQPNGSVDLSGPDSEQAASKRRSAEAAVAAEQAKRAALAPVTEAPLTPEEEAEAIGEDDVILEEDSRSHTDLLRETLGAQIITEEPN
jgi:DNA polymerase-3 subunit gamma/tau